MTQVQWVHQFHVAEKAVKMVQNGQKPFYHMYLLNPSLSYKDLNFFFYGFFFITIIRLILSGSNSAPLNKFPNVFMWLSKNYVKKNKKWKLCESLWYFCWHTFSFLMGAYVFYTEMLLPNSPGWARLLLTKFDQRFYWIPTATEVELGNPGWPLFPLSNIMKNFYLLELAFWISCIIFLFLEHRRSDFYVLLVHHIVTCFLIFISFTCSFWRVGLVTLLTHDFADILLYTVKSSLYIHTPPEFVYINFLVLMVSFFLTRLIIFPFFCIRPIIDKRTFDSIVKSQWDVPGGIILPVFMCILQVLHIFWFSLILKMFFTTFKNDSPKKKIKDIRSDSENSDSEDTAFESDIIKDSNSFKKSIGVQQKKKNV